MAVKVTLVSDAKNRVAVAGQNQKEVKTTGVSPVTNLSQLYDVDATSPNDNDILVYDSATEKYVIKVLPIIDGGSF